MSLSAGTRIGPYEVISSLGAGGMGEVYRARDTRLDRDVALKILPEAFAADPERLRRFEREAKTLASLNHPNIAQLYGTERSGESTALVMEFVPGRTIAEIIDASGALDPDVAIHMAAQIAEALEAAHEAGIVHRDLKPANVKRRDDDIVKVLDFGLARSADTPGAAAAAVSSPTMLSPAATQQGVILGTAGYMSPEQARGRVADKRSDVWAFGVVLYEMLTGRRLFGGDTVTEIIASVIKDTPQLDALPAGTPPAVRQLLVRCLERDPRMRLRDIGEARVALSRVNDPRAQADAHGSMTRQSQNETPRSAARIPTFAALAFAALAGASAAALIAWQLKPAAAPVPARRFELPARMADHHAAIAPDGTRIAYLADGHLYVHELRTGKSADLGEVPPATEPVFFSPDGRRIGYGAESTLRTVPVEGGAPFVVAKVPASGRIMDAEWADDGTIYFSVWRDSLYRVAATGGTPALHAAVDANNEIDFHSLAVLPGHRIALVVHLRGNDGSRIDVVDGASRAVLADEGSEGNFSSVQFAAPDHLLFVRTKTNLGLWTIPLGTGKLDLSKAELVEPDASNVQVARDGTLIAELPAREKSDLVWVTTDGADATPGRSVQSVASVRGTPFETLTSSVALSPDGRRAVVAIRAADGKEGLVVRDLETGADTRVALPQAPGGRVTGATVTWTPSGHLLYAAGGIERLKIYDWPADGSGGGRPVVDGLTARMARDGKDIVFNRDERQRLRLYRAPMLADGTAGQAVPVFPAGEDQYVRYFDLSADGTLLAFTANDATTGQSDVFVTTYPDLRERRQVTSTGATLPRFSRDGRKLYFLGGTRTATGGLTRGELRAVTIGRSPLTVSAPVTLLAENPAEAGGPTLGGFDVAADGRFLMTMKHIAPSSLDDRARLVLLQNWLGVIGR